MSNLTEYSLEDIFSVSIPGEWGADPTDYYNALVIRGADFTKDCKLKGDAGVPRIVPLMKLKLKALQRGDLIIEKSGGSPDQPVGRVVLFDVPDEGETYAHSNFLQLLRTSSDFDSRFIHYLLTYFYFSGRVFRYQQQTTGIINLKLDSYLKEIAFIPDFEVQRRIANILLTIDWAIEKTEVLVEKYQQIKAGLMNDLFTRGIGLDGKLRPPREQAPELYQETPIGWIPKKWGCELLDSLADRGSGHTPSKSYPEYWNGGLKWLSLADSPKLDKLYISDTSFEISEEGIRNSSAVMYPAGIVVLSRDAGIGKSAITTTAMAVSQHFMCWKCGENLDSYFLYYWLQYNKRVFENIAMGSTILTIGLQYFKRLRIGCPTDVNEQQSIAEMLKVVDHQLFALEKDLHKKQKLKSGLMQDLLGGRVPVQVETYEESEASHV